jgi:ribulose-phosphate 3-epimerase
MKIVPAVLANTIDEFELRIQQAEDFAEYIQIDLMDGVFVPTQSFPSENINSLKTSLSFEVHLMVKHPAAYFSHIDTPHLKKVIFHVESEVKHKELIQNIHERGFKAGLAINPETGIETFKHLADDIDTLMFLTVDPCCYGNPYKPEVIKKISKARQIFKEKVIGVDGGASLGNLKSFFNIGVDYVCVGSRIFLKGNPEENYRLFTKRAAELSFDI